MVGEDDPAQPCLHRRLLCDGEGITAFGGIVCVSRMVMHVPAVPIGDLGELRCMNRHAQINLLSGPGGDVDLHAQVNRSKRAADKMLAQVAFNLCEGNFERMAPSVGNGNRLAVRLKIFGVITIRPEH